MSKKIIDEFLNKIINDTKNDKIKWYTNGVHFDAIYNGFIFKLSEEDFFIAEQSDDSYQETPKSKLIGELFNLIEKDINNHKYAINTIKDFMHKSKKSENYMDIRSFVKNDVKD